MQGDSQGNFVALPPSLGLGKCGDRTFLLRKQRSPGTFLFFQELYAHFDLQHGTGIGGPDYLAAGFLFTVLHGDGVADLKVPLNIGEQGSSTADVPGMSVLGKGASIGAHTPYAEIEIHRYARGGWSRG